jgi:outer membrane protein assembly factor BamB
MKLSDGDLLWERDLRGEPVAYVWILGDRVVTADAALERVHLFDRRDGSMIGQVLFQQPDPEHELVRLVHRDGLLFGPQSPGQSDRVVAFDLETGQAAWEFNLDKPLVQLFHPQDPYLGVALLGGDVLLVDAGTGELVIRRRVPGARAVDDGVLFDAIFLVRHIQTVGGKPLPRLVALDLATGDLIWHRDDLVGASGANRRLRLYGGHFPAVVEFSGDGMARRKPMGLVMIDARTGRNVGAAVKLIAADSRTQFSGDFHVFPGGVVIGTEEALVALATTPVDPKTAGKF